MLACPVMMTTSVSGATCLICSSTSMPVSPGIRRSRIAASKVFFSNALTAALPSGQTITSCPSCGIRGAVATVAQLGGLLRRQPHREGAALAGTGAGGRNLAAVAADDPMADRQAQTRALARSAAREERLEDILQNVRRHAAAGVL